MTISTLSKNTGISIVILTRKYLQNCIQEDILTEKMHRQIELVSRNNTLALPQAELISIVKKLQNCHQSYSGLSYSSCAKCIITIEDKVCYKRSFLLWAITYFNSEKMDQLKLCQHSQFLPIEISVSDFITNLPSIDADSVDMNTPHYYLYSLCNDVNIYLVDVIFMLHGYLIYNANRCVVNYRCKNKKALLVKKLIAKFYTLFLSTDAAITLNPHLATQAMARIDYILINACIENYRITQQYLVFYRYRQGKLGHIIALLRHSLELLKNKLLIQYGFTTRYRPISTHDIVPNDPHLAAIIQSLQTDDIPVRRKPAKPLSSKIYARKIIDSCDECQICSNPFGSKYKRVILSPCRDNVNCEVCIKRIRAECGNTCPQCSVKIMSYSFYSKDDSILS